MRKLRMAFLTCILIILFAGIVIGASGEKVLDAESMPSSGEQTDDMIEINVDELIEENLVNSNFELKSELDEIVREDKEHNIMLFDRELNIAGEAKDLIMALGQKITSKAIGSYAFMAATQLDISGEIFKDTFAIGNEVEVNGDIGRDLYALGNSIIINGTVERDVNAAGEELSITGSVGGNVLFAGGEVWISSDTVINGNLELNAEKIQIDDGATILGTLTYPSTALITSVPKNIEINVRPSIEKVEKKVTNGVTSLLSGLLYWSISNFILFAISMAICPRIYELIAKIYKEDTVQRYCSSFGWGLLALIVIPIISILAICTFIGSAIGILGVISYTAILMTATVITSYAFASTFLQYDKNKYIKGLLGIIIVEFLKRLPVIGWLISMIIISIAFGTIIKLIKEINHSSEEE